MSGEVHRVPSPWLWVPAGLVVLAVLVGLGTWQVQRLQWKNALVAAIDSRVSQPPVDLATLLRTGKALAEEEYRPVAVEGEFLHEGERHFLATHGGRSGFFVYTPMRLASGDILFVNRGFVPYDRKDPATRPEGQVAGVVRLIGLLRTAPAEKPSAIVPDNDPARNVFYWKDLRAMAETAGLPKGAPVLGLFVDAGAAENPGGLPVGGVTIVDLPNNHLQYAVTWYGIALALAGVMIAMFLHWRRQAAAPPG